MLHKKAAWFYAAMAVLEIGLPSLTLPDEPEAATMRVRTMANFAEAMAHWLEQFSAAMVKHQASPCYQRALEYSKKKKTDHKKTGAKNLKKLIRFAVHSSALLQSKLQSICTLLLSIATEHARQRARAEMLTCCGDIGKENWNWV